MCDAFFVSFVLRAWRALLARVAFASTALRPLLACVALRAFALAFASDASAFVSIALRSLRALIACVACVIMETRLNPNPTQEHTVTLGLQLSVLVSLLYCSGAKCN